MNFAGPFDAELKHDSPVSLGGERFAFDSKPGFTQHHASDSHVIVPDAHLLFSGDYTRIGSDLIISGDGHKFVVGNYFKGETRPALVSKDGATLSGHIVDSLTGHIHYAQASGAPAAGQVIGNVLKLSGSATAIRNGVSIELHIGDAVQKGDVIQTASDSSVGMTFVDGSAFGMNSNARMVLNEMIYDPNGSSNSSLISLVQGTITFVAGQTAKNGNMRVETPVATMGIRGTAVLVEIGANDGPTKFSVLVEPDGHTGSYNLYDKTTGDLIGTVSQAGQVTFVSVNGIGQPPTALEQLKTLADQQAEKALIQQVFQLFFPNYNPDNSNPKSQKTGFGSPGDNINPFLFNNTAPDNQPIKIIVIPGVGNDPVTGQPNPPRIFFNTKAQFSADTVTAEQSITSSVKTFKISDVVHIDDPDINNGPFFDKATPFVAGSAVIKSAVSTNPNLSASFLSQFLHIDQQTGEVTFDRLVFNFLGQGETATFMLQVLSQSGPDSALVIIPIIISGDNDEPNDDGVPNGTPTIVIPLSDIVGGVKEDTLVVASSLAKDGTITFRDVDLSDTHTVAHEFTSSSSGSILNPVANPSLPGFGPGAHLGTFTLGPIVEDDTDTINTGTVQWHFSLPDNDPTLQSLAEGQTITQVYTITITDQHGAPVTQTVTITITGTNDAPVLTADASVHQAVEAPNTTDAPDSVVDVATGTLIFTDLDLSDTHTASAALHPGATSVVWSGGNYNDIPQATRDALNGATTAAITENSTDTNNQGSVGWEFKLPDHLFDFLAHGETLTLIYDVTVTDNNGVSSTQQITVQIGAANDQPVISIIDTSATVQEDVAIATGNILTDSGAVTFTDTDLTDTHTAHVVYNDDATGADVSTALATALATALTVPASALAAGTHSFNWDFALDNSLVQYLAENETITLSYTITVGDNSNGTNDTSVGQVVTVVITGTNDTPVIDTIAATALTEQTDTSALTLAAPIHITFTDVDLTDVGHTASITTVTTAGVTTGLALTAAQLIALTTLSTVTKASGSSTGSVDVDFSAASTAFDYLAANEQLTLTYTVEINDGDGGITPKTFSITVTGTNDVPVIDTIAATSLTEQTDANPLTLATPIHVTFTDVDLSDVGHTASITDVTTAGVTTGLSLTPAQLIALTTLGTVTKAAGSSTGSVDVDFSAASTAFDYLAVGEQLALTYTIAINDGDGGVTPRTFNVTITGTNDVPAIAGVATGSVTEDAALVGSNLVIDGTLTIVDADHDQSSFVAQTSTAGANGYGTFTLDVSGHWTYTANNNHAAIQQLGTGESLTDTFTVHSLDGTANQLVTVIIHGTNDVPVIAGVATGSVTEDTALVGNNLATNGTLTIVDVDHDQSAFVAQASTAGSNGYGTFTLDTSGHWTYVAANDQAAIQQLGSSDSLTDSFTAHSFDGTADQVVTVTLHGTNDAPVINADNVSPVELGAGVTKILGVTLSDVDAGSDTFTVTATADHGTVSTATGNLPLAGPGVSGSFADISNIFNDGAVYTPQNAFATDKVTLTVTDGHGASDTLNFIFKQYAPGGVTLDGTTGKDWILSSSGDDTMTGFVGHDNFVFAPVSGHDTVMDFTSGEDKIDLHLLTGGPTQATFAAWLTTAAEASGSDTLLHLNGTTDTVLLKGVMALNASDFILHA